MNKILDSLQYIKEMKYNKFYRFFFKKKLIIIIDRQFSTIETHK